MTTETLIDHDAPDHDRAYCMTCDNRARPVQPEAEGVQPPDIAGMHRDALADTKVAYTSFQGWALTCSWCDFIALGNAKREALLRMQGHYDHVIPEGATIR